MGNRIDQLERLAELRRSGMVTADEYESQKAGLLADREGGGAIGRHNRTWLIVAIAIVGLGLAIFGSTFIPSVGQAGGSASWKTTTSKDPMTDAVQRTATRSFISDTAKIVVTISCSSNGRVVYQAAAYAPNDEPVEIRSQMAASGYVSAPFEFRLDDGPAQSAFSPMRDYNNTITFDAAYDLMASATRREVAQQVLSVLQSRRVTFSFHLAHSDEIVRIEQADPAVHSTLAPCVAFQRAAI